MNVKILIVDDFEIVRSNLKRIINQLGVKNIFEASDGQEALDIVQNPENQKEPFDLIFLDWNMPRMNGVEFLAKSKTVDFLKDVPIIMTTAERERKSVLQALSSGAADYIVKPFKASVIQEKFEKFVVKRKSA